MSDANQMYHLVFTGEVLPGFSKKKVVSQMQVVLHLDRGKAERLVEGKRRQIDKELSLQRAEKLRLIILEQGAECILLPIEKSLSSTQEFPEFNESSNDDSSQVSFSDSVFDESIESIPGQPATDDEAKAVSSSRSAESAVMNTNSRLKYLLLAVFILIVGAVIVWLIRPAAVPSTASVPVLVKPAMQPTEKKASASVPQATTKAATTVESKIEAKLRNLSVRTDLWFAVHEGDVDPMTVDWVWIQSDLGISVEEMRDDWGIEIKYLGTSDGFEMRSAGPDRSFFTKDDLVRKSNFQ